MTVFQLVYVINMELLFTCYKTLIFGRVELSFLLSEARTFKTKESKQTLKLVNGPVILKFLKRGSWLAISP